jgi:hypothetical protein
MVQQQAVLELVDLLRLTNTMTGASEIGQPGGLEAAAHSHPALMEASANQLQSVVLELGAHIRINKW